MEHKSLESRIETLERQNRWFRRGALALVTLALVSTAVAFKSASELPDAQFRIVSASKFALVDPRTGKIRAQLAHQTAAGGWAGITLWDEAGKPRAEFKLWEDGHTLLNTSSPDGNHPWEISTGVDGKAKMTLGDREVGGH